MPWIDGYNIKLENGCVALAANSWSALCIQIVAKFVAVANRRMDNAIAFLFDLA